MGEPSVQVYEDAATGDFVMSVHLRREEIAFLSTQVLATQISNIIDRCVNILRDRVVEQVQAEVLAKIDIPSIVNMVNIRTGVALGERIADHTAGKK